MLEQGIDYLFNEVALYAKENELEWKIRIRKLLIKKHMKRHKCISKDRKITNMGKSSEMQRL